MNRDPMIEQRADPTDRPQRTYPEDDRLRAIEEHPDRRMTRKEWEHEDSLARQAAHQRHDAVKHDREVQQEFDEKKQKRHRPWGRILRWVGVGVAVLLLAFLIGYIPHRNEQKRAAAAARTREQEEPTVDVVRVERSSAPGELTVPGTTSALTEAYLFARANGYIKRRYVDIGDHVVRGQLMALLDAPDLDQQVDQARQQLRQAEAQAGQQSAQLDLTRVTWERWRTLVAKGVFSRQDGDQRETDYRAQLAVVASAERNVESYRANLRRAIDLQSYERVTAPFTGIVTERNADVGALVGSAGSAMTTPNPTPQSGTGGSSSPASANTNGSSGMASSAASPSTGGSQGGAIFAVAQVDTLRILVAVPEGYATSIHRGMQAQVFVQAREGRPIPGTVTRAAESLDQNTRTMLAEVDLDNRDHSLYPGMYCMVTFQQLRGEAPLTIPGDAVVIRNDQTTVAVVRNNKVHLAPVHIGRDYGPSVEITGGLHEGDIVVATVTDGVREGATVHPQMNQQAEVGATGKGVGAKENGVPDSGPSQYGDQSIVNGKLEGTNNRGKKGGNTGTANQGQNVKTSGKQPKQKDSSQ